ncbi:unnamed protein product [Dracunculus medinensis]|uniref:Formin_GBD_N domain-containing protein n=1 Tax=Dracunculus medinensis TaxID=318479 RepID=A0A0N4UCW9_DRAME|nr:unnamed protein product [Dracunculus medinensis]
MEESISCRVQYVDDSDPFATTSSSHLEPSRPIMHTFLLHQSIGDQIPEVIRVLRAPHKACNAALQLYKYDGNMGDFGCYLDSDMSLIEQEDELEILKADP